MKTKIRSAIKLVISLSIGFLLIWLVLRSLSDQDKVEIRDAFSRVNYFWVVISALIGMLSHLVRAIRWKMLIVPLGYKPKLLNTFFAVMTMYIGNIAFPRLGEVLRCGVMTRYESIPFQKALGTMVTERVVDLLLLLVVGLITLFFQYDKLYAYFNDILNKGLENKMASISSSFVWILIIITIIGIASLYFLYKIRNRFTFIDKIVQIIKGIIEGVKSIKDVRHPFLFIVLSVLIWAMYLTMIIAAMHSLEETSILGLNAGLAILFFGSFAIIAVQGGIGAYQLIVREILLMYAISGPIGYAIGWIAWGAQTTMILVFGLISIFLLPILNQPEKVESETVEAHSE